jgi:hypothetical protein
MSAMAQAVGLAIAAAFGDENAPKAIQQLAD